MRQNEKGIVVFLDNDVNQQKLFKGLYNSYIYSKTNETTDLIVFTPLEKNAIPSDCIHVKIDSISKNGLFNNYGYINSIYCLATDKANFLYQYKFLLRTDVDTFVTPSFRDLTPSLYMTGHGGYNNDQNIKDNLSTIAKKFKLREQKRYNIGSTHFGYGPLVVDVAKLQYEICKHIFTDWFLDGEGAWAGWYKGVTTMYAGELAVNHYCDEIIMTNQLDYYSDSSQLVEGFYHIHSWHTEHDYSKHKLLCGHYDEIKKDEIKNVNLIKYYCLYNAL
jgi:hypothetical protein